MNVARTLLALAVPLWSLSAQVTSGIMWRSPSGSISVLHPKNGFVASPSMGTLSINWDPTYFNIIPGPQDSALISLQPPAAGPGLQTVNGLLGLNTSIAKTHQSAALNEDNFCASSNGSPNYTCLTNNTAAWQGGLIRGQFLIFIPDTTAFGSSNLTVNFQGPAAIKLSDGVSDPGPLLKSGQAYLLCFDGLAWRMGPGDSSPLSPQWLRFTLTLVGPNWLLNGSTLIPRATTIGPQAIPILTLPPNAAVEMIRLKHSASFTGPSITAIAASLGWSASDIAYSQKVNIVQPVGPTIMQQDGGAFAATMDSHSVLLTLNPTGGPLSAVSAGSLDIWIKYSVLP